MTGLALGLMGCLTGQAPEQSWTEEGAILPTFVRLDTDRSGGIGPLEWTPVSYGAAPFQELDLDASGELEVLELVAWVRRADPEGFDGKRVTLTPSDGTPAGLAPVPREVREVGDAILFLIEEIKGSPENWLPAKEEVRDASWTMSLGSPESRAVLDKLRIAWNVAGREFPTGENWEKPAPEGPTDSSP